MGFKEKLSALVKKYKHAWVFLYILVYMPWFLLLERHVTTNYHVIQIELDEHIPFIEYFVVPYLLWFVFIAAAFLYFFFTDVPGFYRMAQFMFTGMTIFLIISTIFPNGQDLRPVVFERDNIFVDLVRMVYRADTCTNVFPSLHVFNSLSVCVAVCESRNLKKHRGVQSSAAYGGSDHPCNCIFKTALCCRCVRSNDHGIYTVSVHLRSGKEKRSALRRSRRGPLLQNK